MGLWKLFGERAAHAVVGGHLRGSRLNLKLGIALMRDNRITLGTKVFAFAIGAAVAAAVIALEIPYEALLSVVLPAVGLAIDAIGDGVEMVAIPLLAAALVLPFIAPRETVEMIMLERSAATALPAPNAAK